MLIRLGRSLALEILHSYVSPSYYSVVSSFCSVVSGFRGLQIAGVIGYDAVTLSLTQTIFVPLFTGLNSIG